MCTLSGLFFFQKFLLGLKKNMYPISNYAKNDSESRKRNTKFETGMKENNNDDNTMVLCWVLKEYNTKICSTFP